VRFRFSILSESVGTLNLLESDAQHSPAGSVCISEHDKVYGDAPNEMRSKNWKSGTTTPRRKNFAGVAESCRIDQTMHSLFVASKGAADLVAQDMGATSR